MCLKLVELSEENEQYYIEKIVNLVKYHKQYAEKMGIFDKVVVNYSNADAVKHFNDPFYRHFVILNNKNPCGVLQIKIKQSSFDYNQSLHICKIWSEESISGVLRFVINKLKELFPKVNSIELECWYDLPANDIYEHLGFQCFCKNYVKKI